MQIDTREAGSWGWWLSRLDKELTARQSNLKLLNDYYEGRHRLAFASSKFREAFGGLFGEFADNWCELVVHAVDERLRVEGFRIGDETAADKAAWEIWQANQLDADSQLAHTEALINGDAAALVWWDDDGSSPLITVEHPSQIAVATVPGQRRRRAAALKRWCDDDGHEMATLYLPDEIYKFRTARPLNSSTSRSVSRFEVREVGDEPWPLENKLGVVPVVPLVNNPRLLGGGRSEIASVMPLQDAVNKLVADMLVASEFAAFRQRWITGYEAPIDPVSKQPISPFRTGVERILMIDEEDAKVGEFSASDLSNYVRAIETLVQHAASQTRTPPHYFYLKGEMPSGESIKSAETGLVAKARRKMRHFGEAWEEVIRLAFAVAGDQGRADVLGAETIWADPESRTEGEHIDAVLKRKALEVPTEQLWEDAGYTPQQIARFKTILDAAASETIGLAGQIEAVGQLIRAGFDPAAALQAMGMESIAHTGLHPVTVTEE